MQRCLYSFAVRSLIRTRPEVEARLVYPRSEDQSLVLNDTEETLADLAQYLEAARTLFVGGKALSGPDAERGGTIFPWRFPRARRTAI